MDNLSKPFKQNPKTTVSTIVLTLVILALIIVIFVFVLKTRNGHEYKLCDLDGQVCNDVEGKYVVYTDDIRGIGVIKKSLDPTRPCNGWYFGLDPSPGLIKKCYTEKSILETLFD